MGAHLRPAPEKREGRMSRVVGATGIAKAEEVGMTDQVRRQNRRPGRIVAVSSVAVANAEVGLGPTI
jgi:hypothetical protein